MGTFCAKVDASFENAEFDCGPIGSIDVIGGMPKLFSSRLTPVQLQIEAKDGSTFTFDAPEHVIRAIAAAFKGCTCDGCGEAAILRTKSNGGHAPDEHFCEACFDGGESCVDWSDLPLTHPEAA